MEKTAFCTSIWQWIEEPHPHQLRPLPTIATDIPSCYTRTSHVCQPQQSRSNQTLLSQVFLLAALKDTHLKPSICVHSLLIVKPSIRSPLACIPPPPLGRKRGPISEPTFCERPYSFLVFLDYISEARFP
ncbi:unnamed protein product [Chondrus crispus]|uniref:Uncharacterized protein n=1 Tax=Chondrus crispus TaxID=2769 RepID=R7QEW3_CHOCR|nr:unnamed protein product [Chondrus crispus]CDF35960.1 unnamed protein product [Chondrus crispus]|eukprot:XP_005715779.1 unnamed protein product [Chondrus crispus]